MESSSSSSRQRKDGRKRKLPSTNVDRMAPVNSRKRKMKEEPAENIKKQKNVSTEADKKHWQKEVKLQLKAHLEGYHNCYVCMQGFSTRHALENHIKVQHRGHNEFGTPSVENSQVTKNSKTKKKDDNYCTNCETHFDDSRSFWKHLAKCSAPEPPNNESEDSFSVDPTEQSGSGDNSCDLCNVNFPTRGALLSHNLAVHPFQNDEESRPKKVRSSKSKKKTPRPRKVFNVSSKSEIKSAKPKRISAPAQPVSSVASNATSKKRQTKIDNFFLPIKKQTGEIKSQDSKMQEKKYKESKTKKGVISQDLSSSSGEVGAQQPSNKRTTTTWVPPAGADLADVRYRNQKSCDLCNKDYKTRASFLAHCDVQHPKSHPCDICKEEFPTVTELQKHRKEIHPGQPYTCPYCPVIFVSAFSRKKHILWTHSEEKKYKCDHCGKLFKYPANRTAHIKEVHTNEKRFFCKQCPAGFYGRQKLEEHFAKEHMTEKNFICEQADCGKAFRTKSQLRQHYNLMHEERTFYDCELCKAKGKKKGSRMKGHKSYRDHMKLKHNIIIPSNGGDKRVRLPRRAYNPNWIDKHLWNHVCPKCNKDFKYKAGLLHHQTLKECPVACTYDFHTEEDRLVHMEKHHDATIKFNRFKLEASKIIRSLRKIRNTPNIKESLMKLRNICEQYSKISLCKIYCLVFVPEEVEDIFEYISNPENEFYVYVGKQSLSRGPAHISKHHQFIRNNGAISTHTLSALSGFKCYHVCDYWVPNTSKDFLSVHKHLNYVEAKAILKLFLFSVFWKKNLFFQNLEIKPLCNISKKEIEDTLEDIQQSQGNFLRMMEFGYQFKKECIIAQTNTEKLACGCCGTDEKLYSKTLRLRHEAECFRRNNKAYQMNEDDCILPIKKINVNKIVHFFKKEVPPSEPICYTVIGIFGKLKNIRELLQKFVSDALSMVYDGQNSQGIMSRYHFWPGHPSTLKNLVAKGMRIYQAIQWDCTSEAEMYQLEVALMINQMIRDYLSGKNQLANRVIPFRYVSQMFTAEEWEELIEYSLKYSLLEDKPPSFIKARRNYLCIDKTKLVADSLKDSDVKANKKNRDEDTETDEAEGSFSDYSSDLDDEEE